MKSSASRESCTVSSHDRASHGAALSSHGAALSSGAALSRRAFLAGSAAAVATTALSARADSVPPRMGIDRELRWLDHGLRGPDGARTRTLIFAPAGERPQFIFGSDARRYPALLLFDGTSGVQELETWQGRYGLFDIYAELRRPPLVLDPERARFMTARQLARVNTELEKQPFVGLSLICPPTPLPSASDVVLANYCDWLARELLPRAGLLARMDETPCLGIVGLAAGASLALEVFARKPHLFRAFGAAQPRIESVRATQLARRLAPGAASSGFAGIYLQTAAGHAQVAATRGLHRELRRRGIHSDLDELLGLADEASWRHAGLLSMLAWHERTLQLVERPDPDTAPVQSDPPSKRDRRRPHRT